MFFILCLYENSASIIRHDSLETQPYNNGTSRFISWFAFSIEYLLLSFFLHSI